MGQIDMRPKQDEEAEEVKEAVSDVEATDEKVGGEGAADESSPSEQTQEVEESEATETETTDVSTQEAADKDREAIEALQKEKDRLLESIKELRTTRRDLREKPAEPLFVEKPKDDELKDVSPDDVNLIEKVLRSKGYVRKEELHEVTYKTEVEKHKDAWLDAHPEYKPENDPNDEKWNALNDVIKNYFKAPASPKDITKVLDLAHNFVSPKKPLPVRSGDDAEAAKKKILVSSKSGGGASSKTPSEKPTGRNIDKAALKGFSKEELEEYFS